MFVPPLTPPSSDPGSPGSSMAAAAHAVAQANQQQQQQQHSHQQQNNRRTTPPPPYQQQQLQQQGHPLSSICPNIIALNSSSPTSVGHLMSPGRSLTTLGQTNAQLLVNPSANSNTAASNSSSNSNNNSVSSSSSNTRGGSHTSTSATPAHLANLIVPAVRTVRYNRRNNPELEKRRIHHCDYVGKCNGRFIFI